MPSSRLWWLQAIIWVLAMAMLSPYDQELSRKLCSPDSCFGHFVQAWAVMPACVAVALALLASRKQSKLWSKAILYQCLFHAILLTHILKQFWGRTRPGDVLSHPELYTSFFTPAGPFLGESFPSGHVASALVLAPLPFVFWKEGKRLNCLLWSIGLGLFWLATAYGRVLFGVHYPTDCLFSLGSGLLSAQLIVEWLSRGSACHPSTEKAALAVEHVE